MKFYLAILLTIIIVFSINIKTPQENVYEHDKEETTKEKQYSFDEDKAIEGDVFFIDEKNIKIPVFLYHEFYESNPPKDKYNLISTPEKFEEDIKEIIDSGYSIISFERLIKYKNGEKGIPEKSAVITFDDGYISNYTIIYPILKKYNVPCTIFVINDLIGMWNYFNWEQAKEMEDSGLVKIYSHGYSHIRMTDVKADELKSKMEKTNEEIVNKLSEKRTKIFSYPYGVRNQKTDKTLKEIGYETFVTTIRKWNTNSDIKSGIINRVTVPYNSSVSKSLNSLK